MAQQDRYVISYIDRKGHWNDVTAKTRQDGDELYDMVDSDCKFKVLYDNVSGIQLRQT